MAYNPDCIYCQVVIDWLIVCACFFIFSERIKQTKQKTLIFCFIYSLDAIIGHPRATPTGGRCPQPALPEQEETRARGFWTQEGHWRHGIGPSKGNNFMKWPDEYWKSNRICVPNRPSKTRQPRITRSVTWTMRSPTKMSSSTSSTRRRSTCRKSTKRRLKICRLPRIRWTISTRLSPSWSRRSTNSRIRLSARRNSGKCIIN